MGTAARQLGLVAPALGTGFRLAGLFWRETVQLNQYIEYPGIPCRHVVVEETLGGRPRGAIAECLIWRIEEGPPARKIGG